MSLWTNFELMRYDKLTLEDSTSTYKGTKLYTAPTFE